MAARKTVSRAPSPAKPVVAVEPAGKGISVKMLVAIGAVGVGAYLLWRQFGRAAPAAASVYAPTPTPGAPAVTPSPLTTTDLVPPYTLPAQYPTQTATASTPEAYLEMLGKPKAGATVTGPLPPASMFPAFKGKAGPKQEACLAAGGTWTGPKGKKFCVKPA
jgi:hypothetical protein